MRLPLNRVSRLLVLVGAVLVLISGVVWAAVSAGPEPTASQGQPTADGPTATDGATPDATASGEPSASTSGVPTAATPTSGPAPSSSPPHNVPVGGCMPHPSSCGWPDESNTGVPAGVSLTRHDGDLIVTTPGTVIDRLDIRGCLEIKADNVTVRKSRIGAGGCPYFLVRSWGRSGLVLEDTEIVLGSLDTKGISGDGYTARRVWFHGGADCATVGSHVVIEDSYCDIKGGGTIGDRHIDGIEDTDGSDIVLRHNTIRNPYAPVSAILMPDSTHVSIVDNLVAGGGFTIYCPRTGVLDAYSGNRFSRMYYADGGYWGPDDHCPLGTGNVWDDTGAPL